MNHRTVLDYKGDMVYTSENLWFSAKWAYSYITSFNLPVINCSERGLLQIGDSYQKPLEEVLSKVAQNPETISRVQNQYESLRLATMNYNFNQQLFEKTRRCRYDSRC
jgi:hypothetical protein